VKQFIGNGGDGVVVQGDTGQRCVVVEQFTEDDGDDVVVQQ